MTQSNQTFTAADLSSQFKQACIHFDNLLASTDSQEIAAIRKKFQDGLKDYEQKGALTVAFIGQYSAGKSTIISALTGQHDIHIDADIATDTATLYDWNGIKIIDTPGLFTDRADHDDLTYEQIAKADLLVFCLTHMLFDTLTVENFKKLAYDKGYRWKIMLVINKMSAAAGEEEQKIASYRHSLVEALTPYGLDEFPICFIDAKDYCDGIDEGDDFLIEVSRFDTFIVELNRFVQRRAALTGLDTPVRIVLGCLDDAQIGFARNSDEDTAFLEVLSRLSRRINKERERLRTKIKGITLEMSSKIATEGSRLASAVGDPNFEELNKQSEINVRKHYEQAGEALKNAIENAVQSIRFEVEAELQSNLTQAFVAQLNFDDQFSDRSSVPNFSNQQVQAQVEWLKTIGNGVRVQVTKTATRGFANTAGQGFLRSIDVAGSQLHQGVYTIGKFIGFKFQPWQAVGIAKNIGNAAMLLGPVLAAVSIGTEAHTMYKEHEYEKKKADARLEITSQFKKIAVELERQIEEQLREFESQVYVQIENDITEARQKTSLEMMTSHTELRQIAEIRKELETIIRFVQQAATASVL